MHLIDFIVFIAFTLGVVVFGCSFFKKGSSADEFTSAGHSIPGWVVGMSIFATYVSSISYIGYPGKAFAADWNAFVFSFRARPLQLTGTPLYSPCPYPLPPTLPPSISCRSTGIQVPFRPIRFWKKSLASGLDSMPRHATC